MNPKILTIPHNTIVKVASGVNIIDLQKMEGGKVYYKTYRDYNEGPPELPINLNTPREPITSEWLEMEKYVTTFKSDVSSDVYIYCTGGDPEKPGILHVGRFSGFNLSTSAGAITPFELSISMGLVPGYSTVDKFGVNQSVTTTEDPEDIWEYGGDYPYDPVGTAPIVSLVSDSANDTEDILVIGLDIDGNEVSQTITLTGNTRVALTTPLWRVYRMSNEGAVDLEGTVYCYTGTTNVPGTTEIRAIINGSSNQTLMALYTVPKGKVAFLYRGELGMQFETTGVSTLEYAHCHYESRRYNKVFRVKKSITLLSNASSNYLDKRSFPDPVPALTDLKLRAVEVSADMGVWATFDLLLIDEELFPPEYLEKIGQPL